MKEENKKESAEELFERGHNKFKVLRLAIQGILNDDQITEVEKSALHDFCWEIDSLFDDYATRMESEEKTNDEETVKGIEGVLKCVMEGAFATKEAAVKHLKEHAVPLDGIIERAAQLKKRAEKTKASYLSYIDQLEAGGK